MTTSAQPTQNKTHNGSSGQRSRRPAVRRQAAAQWLSDMLGEQHVTTSAVYRAAREAGYRSQLLAKAADDIGVVKRGGEGSTGLWAMPGTPPPEAEKRECSTCHAVLPLYEFARHTRGKSGYGRVCLRCDRTRKRRSEAALRDDSHPDVINRAVSAAPDPDTARALRRHLAWLRRSGEDFDGAWTVAVRIATAGLPPAEAQSWRSAFADTRDAWEAAYLREGHGALAELTAAA